MEQRHKNGIAFALAGGFAWLFGLAMPDSDFADLVQGVGILCLGVGVLVLVVALLTPRRD